MKEKRFFPEKGLLMLSGVAFLLLTVPAWVQGFMWCGVAAVLLGVFCSAGTASLDSSATSAGVVC